MPETMPTSPEGTRDRVRFHAVGQPKLQATERLQGITEVVGAPLRYTYEYPLEEVTDEVPFLIIPGYGGIKPAYRRLRESLVQSGKPAITLRPLRCHSIAAATHPSYFLKPSALPSRAVYGIMNDLRISHGVDTFDLAGHSMGGWVASRVAERHSDKVRSVSLVASAGLEDHSPTLLIKRLPKFFAKEFLPRMRQVAIEDELRFARDALHYVLRNPARTLAEGVAVAKCDIRPSLVRLGECGVRTAILNFSSDYLIQNKTTKSEVGHLVDHCETHERSDLGHLAPQVHPDLVASRLVEISRKINASEPRLVRPAS